MSLSTIIFDLFGTLVSMEETRPYLKLFADLRLTSGQMHDARCIAMTENFDTLDSFVQRLVPGTVIDTKLYQDEVDSEISSARPYPESIRVLDRLHDKGYRIGLISNLATPYKQVFFDCGLYMKIHLWAFSCDTGMVKPEPGIYLRLLRRMSAAPEEAIMVGDKMRTDVLGPRGVGMDSVLLDRSGREQESIRSLDGVFDYL